MDLADLFTCPAEEYNGLRLLPSACAQNWRRGKTAQPWDRNYPCRGCSIGAVHAGEAPPATDPQDDPRRCAYCGRTDMRLVCRSLCVSCANRVFELVRGRYRRVNPPGIGARLIAFQITFADEETNELDDLCPERGSCHDDSQASV